MRKLIISTVAAASLAAISGVAGAQQQSGNPIPPDQIGPSAAASTQADDTTSADANVSSTSSPTSSNASSDVTTTTTTGAGASVDFQGAEAAPTPPASYPICKGKIQDECVNPREAGLNYGNRPLKYWPGHPASQ